MTLLCTDMILQSLNNYNNTGKDKFNVFEGGQVAPEDRATALQHRADLAELIGFEKSRASLSRTPKLVRELVHLGMDMKIYPI